MSILSLFFQFGSDVYLCYKKSITKRTVFTHRAGTLLFLFVPYLFCTMSNLDFYTSR